MASPQKRKAAKPLDDQEDRVDRVQEHETGPASTEVPKPKRKKVFDTAGEPSTPAGAQEKRSLRSRKGGTSHTKSDLAKYFPDLDEVLFVTDPDSNIPEFHTQLFIYNGPIDGYEAIELEIESTGPASNDGDECSASIDRTAVVKGGPPLELKQVLLDAPDPKQATSSNNVALHSGYGGEESTTKSNKPRSSVRKFDFSTTNANSATGKAAKTDPLDDDKYLGPHRRAEKKEKMVRNVEKEKALHEKSELERILAELKGSDWLRTLGIGGVTESEKRSFEPKRDLFVKRIKSLLQKFADWKTEEKQLEQGKDPKVSPKNNSRRSLPNLKRKREKDETETDQKLGGKRAKHDPVPDNEQDASVSQPQGKVETIYSPNAKRVKTSAPKEEQAIPKPFTSFFAKKHERDAALGGYRRGRKVMAFGCPVPDPAEEYFELPEDIMTEKVKSSQERKRRRMNRSKEND
ncbi:MAG: hypothetical protein M1831_000953 [Alyxoria varia]|nr:MAG: hypothetical protein M1831_000953 [Alyxoria varia]